MSGEGSYDGNADGHILLPGGRIGVLLIHGLGGTPVEMRYVAQALNKAGYTVFCPLLVGHGGSEELLNTTTWVDWYRSVEEAHDKLAERCDVILAGGLSAGVMLALHLAAQRPDRVHGTIMFSPTFWPNGWAIPWYFHFFRLVRYKWFANLIHLREQPPYGIKDERIRGMVLESLQSEGRALEDIFGRKGGTVLEFRWLAEAVKKEIGAIKQPTLIFHPRFDDQSHISNTTYLQRKLGGLVDVVVLEDSYHMVTLDKQRAVVADRTVSFVAWVAEQLAQKSEVERIKRSARRD
jgi:carboxylesterase